MICGSLLTHLPSPTCVSSIKSTVSMEAHAMSKMVNVFAWATSLVLHARMRTNVLVYNATMEELATLKQASVHVLKTSLETLAPLL